MVKATKIFFPRIWSAAFPPTKLMGWLTCIYIPRASHGICCYTFGVGSCLWTAGDNPLPLAFFSRDFSIVLLLFWCETQCWKNKPIYPGWNQPFKHLPINNAFVILLRTQEILSLSLLSLSLLSLSSDVIPHEQSTIKPFLYKMVLIFPLFSLFLLSYRAGHEGILCLLHANGNYFDVVTMLSP